MSAALGLVIFAGSLGHLRPLLAAPDGAAVAVALTYARCDELDERLALGLISSGGLRDELAHRRLQFLQIRHGSFGYRLMPSGPALPAHGTPCSCMICRRLVGSNDWSRSTGSPSGPRTCRNSAREK